MLEGTGHTYTSRHFRLGSVAGLTINISYTLKPSDLMGFIIPEDFMTSEGIINTVDPIG